MSGTWICFLGSPCVGSLGPKELSIVPRDVCFRWAMLGTSGMLPIGWFGCGYGCYGGLMLGGGLVSEELGLGFLMLCDWSFGRLNW